MACTSWLAIDKSEQNSIHNLKYRPWGICSLSIVVYSSLYIYIFLGGEGDGGGSGNGSRLWVFIQYSQFVGRDKDKVVEVKI